VLEIIDLSADLAFHLVSKSLVYGVTHSSLKTVMTSVHAKSNADELSRYGGDRLWVAL